MHVLILGMGSILGMAVFEVVAETLPSGFSFAAGTDSNCWAQARSNARGQVMIESPKYPRGLWPASSCSCCSPQASGQESTGSPETDATARDGR
jgi:hypothetical protein